MSDESQSFRTIHWRELFPFTNIFRAFRIAVHPSKLILALIAVLLIYSGGRLMDLVWPDTHKPVAYLSVDDELHTLSAEDRAQIKPLKEREGIFITFAEYEIDQLKQLPGSVLALSLPGVHGALYNAIVTGPSWLFQRHPVFGILFGIWFLLIWSLFGGAISRIAAVHVARDEKISVRQALRFAASKILSFVFAPLIPIIIILFLGALLATGGLLYYIKGLGPIVAGLLFILALIGGFIITLVAIGTVAGFNLMYPTVAVEGSDSFDAISRSFSYVFARPWRMLWYTLVALIYGAITYLFVRFFLYLVLCFTHFFTSWWLGDTTRAANSFEALWPDPTKNADLVYHVNFGALNWAGDVGGSLMAFWIYLVIALLGAFAISFYFSANSIIYYLMRREVDATDLDDVYLEDADDEFGETIIAAPAEGTSSAPGGGITDSAGSSTPGGDAPKPYSPPTTENPPENPST